MCGIAGFVGLQTDEAHAPLPFDWTRMVRALAHRGPDDDGFFIAPGVGIGMRRLSIIDLAGGAQPIANERGTVNVVYNGEIYNYRELRAELEARGHQFHTQSDTETIVHGYEEWGDDVARRLRAMYAFALWDAPRKKLLLARDQFGIKPLYYTILDGTLWFASEIKAFLLHPRVRRELDPQALDQYLSFLYVPAPHTMFRGICELPPAHRLRVEQGRVSVERYWTPELTPRKMSDAEARELTVRAFDDSVRAQLVSEVPLGAFLSGGIDSASIVAMMKQHTDQPVKTFSIGFGRAEQHWDETDAAARVAKFFGTEHHAFHVEPNIVELVPQVVAGFDQPFANPTAVLLLLLARETRKHVTVALAGTGGDELFAGYPRYLGMLARERYAHAPQSVRRVLAEGARVILRDADDGQLTAQRMRRFLEGGALPFDECYLQWMTVIDATRKREVYSAAFRQALNGADPFAFARTPLDDGRVPEAERLLLTDWQTYLPFNQLAYADRMSMAASLEVRVPFVDQFLFDAVKDIPLRQKVEGNQTKALFRRALAPHLPPFILDAPKQGLNLPIALWFRGPLRPWLGELLSPQVLRARGLFDVAGVQSIRAEHDAGWRDHSLFLWALAILEVWHRQLLDGGNVAA